ncbi:hypothetical protein RF11_13337 [Thelohanellus kitauei]|uniref:Uncharacterized protein n=1 Tax=Thelohanellus kitauei TaxID=669202 RepID=A0A0C2J9C9_THEKT|nr:hypothetical protein RF11_13337 [Thelohanellus kitauei]
MKKIIHRGVNGELFKGFLSGLVDILGGDGDITLVMDTVKFQCVRHDFRDAYSFEFAYLQHFSHFLNPRKEVFSKIKNCARREGRVKVKQVGIVNLRKKWRTQNNKVLLTIYLLGKIALFLGKFVLKRYL